jgi:hypothetical protein
MTLTGGSTLAGTTKGERNRTKARRQFVVDLQLKGKIGLVTGSTAGTGLAIACRLAGEGATVIINGRSENRVGDAIAAIRQKHPHATQALRHNR